MDLSLYTDKSPSITHSELVTHVRTYPGTPDSFWSKRGPSHHRFEAKGERSRARRAFFRPYVVATQSSDNGVFDLEILLASLSNLATADDYVTVVKKLLTSSQGQGLVGHSRVCYSNRQDQWPTSSGGYSTRCNPIFKVMGEFLGYTNHLFCRTHEFSKWSWIYFPDRGDALAVGENGIPYCQENLFL